MNESYTKDNRFSGGVRSSKEEEKTDFGCVYSYTLFYLLTHSVVPFD